MQSINPATSPSNYDPSVFERRQLEARMHRCVRWFYWIAGLSLINTIISLNGGEWSFGVGLALTQVADVFAKRIEGPAGYAVLSVDFICVAVFALFGLLGSRGQSWAILFGIVLYFLDGLLLIGLMFLGGGLPIVGIVIHALALYYLIHGFTASRQLTRIQVNPGPPSPDVMSTMGRN